MADRKYFYKQSIAKIPGAKWANELPFGSAFEFLCPDCGEWGKITTEQYFGREPIRPGRL